MAEDTNISSLCSVTEQHCADLRTAVAQANHLFHQDPNHWIKHSLNSSLGPWIAKYSDLYSRLGVSSNAELLQLFKSAFGSSRVREVYEELVEAEDIWTSFLAEVDSVINTNSVKPLKENDVMPPHLSLRNMRNEPVLLEEVIGDEAKVHLVLLRHFACLPCRDHVASLQRNRKLFSEAGCKVVVISFGVLKGAEKWLEETGCSFEFYLDPRRLIYSLFGLERSVAKVWSMSTIQYYAQQKAGGRALPVALADVEDDPLQMGGDFTIDKNLRVVMAYPSKTPKDRPTIQHIALAAAAGMSSPATPPP